MSNTAFKIANQPSLPPPRGSGHEDSSPRCRLLVPEGARWNSFSMSCGCLVTCPKDWRREVPLLLPTQSAPRLERLPTWCLPIAFKGIRNISRDKRSTGQKTWEGRKEGSSGKEEVVKEGAWGTRAFTSSHASHSGNKLIRDQGWMQIQKRPRGAYAFSSG